MAIVSDERGDAIAGDVLTVEGKQFGRGNKALFPDFQMPLPVEWRSGGTVTLSELIERIVRAEVAAFRERQEKRTVLQALSAEQIAAGAAKGKIDSGGSPDAVQSVDTEESVRNALRAFEDGIYFVFVNDRQIGGLNETIPLTGSSHVTFLRLVALAGG